ncbi:WLM domain-containing protein [Limtongia smithiae]|uniref:WLM domain-containing protein n=1 Tax=Limtongia smithiae TaxID=1125753 RepID=UPI0034CDE2B6
MAGGDKFSFSVSHAGSHYDIELPADATVHDLQTELEELTEVPPSYQKLLIPKHGLAKPADSDLPLSDFFTLAALDKKPAKLMLIGTKPALASIVALLVPKKQKVRPPPRFLFDPTKTVNKRAAPGAADAQQYTFHKLVPLPFLPNPERSLEFLERLRDDRGVRAIMTKYKWSVPVLTEMDPASHTTHDGKTLGLNRNMGQVIELRLRTDTYDGYRDYNTVRKTLCHELAHNVYSPGHPPAFWELTKKLEREVIALDPFNKQGARVLSTEEVYQPATSQLDDEEDYQDSGGWEGGSFVLGSGESQPASEVGITTTEDIRRLSPRELMLRAAEARFAAKPAKKK